LYWVTTVPYNTNAWLPGAQAALLQYVKDGGTVVTQYNTRNWLSSVPARIGPLAFEISNDRVTDETADVRFALATHATRTRPNALGPADFAGWVQERLDQRVRQLLIDEFQDTSPLQWRTLEGWLAGYAGAGGGASGRKPLSLFIVGDPKQSIYGFRRADPRVFVAARDVVVQAFDGARLACA